MKKDHKLAIIKYDEVKKNVSRNVKSTSLTLEYMIGLKKRHPLAAVTVRKTTNEDINLLQGFDYIATDGSKDVFYSNELLIVE